MNYKSILVFTLCLMINGCQTYLPMSKEAPDKYMEVIQADSSTNVEASLKASGAQYTCKELFFGNNSAKNRRACYVKVPEENRFKALAVNMQGAPEALLTDAGNAVMVVGWVALDIYLQNLSARMQ